MIFKIVNLKLLFLFNPKRHWVLILIFACFLPHISLAIDKLNSENLGEFKMSPMAIQIQGIGQEKKGSQFQWVDSHIGLQWFNDSNWKTELQISSEDLRSRSVFFYPKSNEYNLLRFAYIQKDTEYANFSFGRMEVPFSRLKNHIGWTLPTVMEEISLWTNSDWGVAVQANHKAYETKAMVFNGEGESDSDKRLWFAGEWKYESESEFGVLVSGLTGETDTGSTDATGSGGPRSKAQSEFHLPFDPLVKSKIRFTQLAVFKKWNHSRIWGAVTKGDIFQNETKKSIQHSVIETLLANRDFGLFFRHEFWQPDFSDKNYWEKRISIGGRWTSSDRLVSGYLAVTKILEETEALANDKLVIGVRVQSDWIQ